MTQLSKAKEFDPIDIQVLIKGVKVETGKKTDGLFIPGEDKKQKQADKYQFYVEKIGSEVGKGREPYFNRSDIKIGDEVLLKHTVQLVNRTEIDGDFVFITTHDILGVKRGEAEA